MTAYEELFKNNKGEKLNKEMDWGEPVGRERIWFMTDDAYEKEYCDKNKKQSNGKENN